MDYKIGRRLPLTAKGENFVGVRSRGRERRESPSGPSIEKGYTGGFFRYQQGWRSGMIGRYTNRIGAFKNEVGRTYFRFSGKGVVEERGHPGKVHENHKEKKNKNILS
jgi:hypothetical protein